MTMPDLPGVLEAALYVDDLDAAEAFYGGILGLPVVIRQEGRHVFFRAGQTIVLIFRAEATKVPPGEDALPVPTHGAKGEGHLCFAASAEQLDLIEDHLKANDVPIEADFNWPHGPRSIYVRDPAGNSVEFAEPSLWGIDA